MPATGVKATWTGGNQRFIEKVSGNNKQVQFKLDTVFIGGTTTNTVSFDTSASTLSFTSGISLGFFGSTATSQATGGSATTETTSIRSVLNKLTSGLQALGLATT